MCMYNFNNLSVSHGTKRYFTRRGHVTSCDSLTESLEKWSIWSRVRSDLENRSVMKSCFFLLLIQLVSTVMIQWMHFQAQNYRVSLYQESINSPGRLNFVLWPLIFSVQLLQFLLLTYENVYPCTRTEEQVSASLQHCGSSAWNLPHVTLLAHRFWRWILDMWEICGPLIFI